jgi:hypothetical protein
MNAVLLMCNSGVALAGLLHSKALDRTIYAAVSASFDNKKQQASCERIVRILEHQ